MARYVVSGAAGAASSTAATAGILKIDNPSASTMAAAQIKEFAIGPGAAAEDSNYTIDIKRQTTAGTWTSVTPAAKDNKAGASITTAGRVSTAAGSASTVMGYFGFNQRGGFRYVCTPGGEWVNALTFSYGIILEYAVVAGTAVNYGYLEFEE